MLGEKARKSCQCGQALRRVFVSRPYHSRVLLSAISLLLYFVLLNLDVAYYSPLFLYCLILFAYPRRCVLTRCINCRTTGLSGNSAMYSSYISAFFSGSPDKENILRPKHILVKTVFLSIQYIVGLIIPRFLR